MKAVEGTAMADDKKFLYEPAIRREEGKRTPIILMAYLESGGALVQSAQPSATVQQQPQGIDAGGKVRP